MASIVQSESIPVYRTQPDKGITIPAYRFLCTTQLSSGPCYAGPAMRIVIDTNVLIAALTRTRGTSARIVNAWLDGRIEVVASEATIREAELVLGGGWLSRMAPGGTVESLLDQLRTRTVRVGAPPPIADLRLKDEGDRRLVEAAVGGGASHIVTTDREFLRARGYAGVEFVTPTEFVKRVGEASDTNL